MDIKNKNEFQTHQGFDSRHMQKANCADKKVLGEHSTQYNNVIDDSPACNVNKVYMHMIRAQPTSWRSSIVFSLSVRLCVRPSVRPLLWSL